MPWKSNLKQFLATLQQNISLSFKYFIPKKNLDPRLLTDKFFLPFLL